MRLDPVFVKHQIEMLKAQFPDVFSDEDSWSIALETETDLIDFLRHTEQKRQEAIALAKSVELIIENNKLRRERFERRDIAARALIFSLMQSANLRKLELPESTLSIRNGSPKVIITDEMDIPDELCRYKREPDKTKIKEALIAGPVPGASLSNAEDVLAIRIK